MLRRPHVGGFADIEWHTSSENEREGVDVAELDVFATYQLSNAWSALGEVVGERNWRPRSEKSVELTPERFYLEYSHSDALRVEIGETQTGIIRWNEREHRSRFLQTPIDLPAIARRPEQDGAWPLRFSGIYASGRTRGPAGLTWGIGAGSGPGRNREGIPVVGRSGSPAGLLSLAIAPDASPGLEFAVAGYLCDVRMRDTTMHERDVTLSASYVSRGFELRSEWAGMNHRFESSPHTFRTTGYYVLFSQRLTGAFERLRPYLLLDRLTLARDESYLAAATDENAWATGIRYDVTQRFTIKGEYRSQRALNGDRESVVGAQFGFSF